MAQSKKIVIIRHGETEWNIYRKLQGQANSDLTELGKKQALLTAQAIKNEVFDKIYSSDLPRCVETAKILNHELGLAVVFEKGLRERHFGQLQGKKHEEIKALFPDLHSKLSTGNINFEIPGGESFKDFYIRVNDTLDRLAANAEEEKILIVSHGGALDCVIRRIFGLPLDMPRRFSIYNTSINRFSVHNNDWKLDTWGDINHLKEIDTMDDF
jgi:2,3-bisphosphoglycerate-dependent phosphoglycerate mutase